MFDLAVALVVLAAAAGGAWKGLTGQLAAALSPVAGLGIGIPLCAGLAPQDRWLPLALLYIGLSLAVHLLAIGARKLLDRLDLRSWDRHLGFVSGALAGALVAVLLTCAAVAARGDLRDGLRATLSGRAMAKAVDMFHDVIPPGIAPFLAPLRADRRETASTP